MADNTLLVYFSDNGPNTHRWNGDMKSIKGSVDEGGVRSPLFIRWPAGGIRQGHVVREIAGAIDLLPTLCSLAGVSRVGDRPLDGRDLSPLLRGETIVWPDRFLFSHWNGAISVRSQQYRLDPGGALFDLVRDPSQKQDLAAENPAMAAKMMEAANAWRAEMKWTTTDDRPFPVGYREFPRTPLPARDGVPHGGIRRSAGAPNCSYFVNWTSTEDKVTWDVEIMTTGDYEVELQYTCPLADAGSTLKLEFQGTSLSGEVKSGWDPPLYTNQDTIARPAGESRMKEFHPLRLGTIRLSQGRGQLTLRATQVPGKQVMDLRQLNLTLLP